MPEFIMLMHADAAAPPSGADWSRYLAGLRERDAFDGGSAIGAGECFRNAGAPSTSSSHITGYIRVRAESPAGARRLLEGNPVYEGGGTVEIRELPRN